MKTFVRILNKLFSVISIVSLMTIGLNFAPVTARALSPAITSVSAGADHSCAVTGAGAVFCWGSNSSGQLGDGTTTDNPLPTPVSNLSSGVTSVSVGDESSCALTNSGTVYCWGVLAGKSGAYSSTPVLVPGLSDVSTVSVGSNLNCALSSATAYCWGSNGYGQLGNGSYNTSSTPVAVSLSNVVAVSAGSSSACAIDNSGNAYCWGSDVDGLLGNGTKSGSSSSPVQVSGLSNALSISSGSGYACAVANGGAAYCWGNGSNGTLGTGTSDDSAAPAAVKNLTSGALQISAGQDHACALTGNGSVYCWGLNNFGELGNGTSGSYAYSFTPTLVSSITNASSVSAGAYHSCTLAGSNDYCWGYGGDGELGLGTYDNNLVPTEVIFPQPPQITSAGSAEFTYGENGSFTVETSGNPAASLSESGSLPSGLVFTDNGDGTATLSGSPASGSEGTYNVSLNASNKFGSTSQNFTLTVGKEPQTVSITSSAPSDAVYNGTEYSVTTNGGMSGNPVEISSETSAVCTVNGASVSFVGVGTCTIDANQKGNTDYLDATQAQQSFSVNQAAQNITFTSTAPSDASYGGSYQLAATGGASGNPVVFSSATPSVCSLQNSSVSFVGTGTCTIDANQAGNDDYLDAPQAEQTFNVGKAPVSLSANQAQVKLAFLSKTVTLSAQLSLGSGMAIAGENLTFTLQNQYVSKTCTAVTNSTGLATCTITYNLFQLLTPIPASYSVSYAGTSDYLSASAVGAVPQSWLTWW